MKNNSLTEGRIARAIIFFALPMIAGSMIQQLYTAIDAVIVGQFAGKAGLAAIDSVSVLFRFPINFMNGLAAGATIIISRHFGAGEKKELSNSIRASVSIAVALGIVSSIAGVIFAPQLLRIMKVPADIFADSLGYCQIYFGGLFALILYNMMAGILRAFGDSKRPLYILIMSSIVNIAGDYLLVGVFGLGVRGAATSTVIAQLLSVIVVGFMLAKSGYITALDKGHFFEATRSFVGRIIAKGFPLALQSMLFPVANAIVQASVNKMGTDPIAAWGICEKMNLIIWLISDSMSPVLTTYTAQNLGAKKEERVLKGVYTGAGLSVGAVVLLAIVLYFGAGVIGSWFVPETDVAAVIPLVKTYMHMMAPFLLFYAIAEAFSGACCGLGDTVSPMITTLVTICLLRVVCIWTILPHFNSMECIAWIYIVSWIAAGVAFLALYHIKNGKYLRNQEI